MSEQAKKTQIVIVGGGAGGLELARRLGAKFGRERHDIVLIDRNRSHIWKPLLHEVAAGSLDANMDEVGYGGHGTRWGYRFFNGELEGIDRQERLVITAPMVDETGSEIIARHSIRYDYLILAVGGVSNDFGVRGVQDHCHFLENRQQADRFRQRLLNLCLRTSHLAQTTDTDPVIRIAIVGGGATGVELGAELYNAADSLRHYGLEVFDRSRMKVTLLEAGPRILPALPEKLSAAAHHELEDCGVDVRVGAQVSVVEPDRIRTKDGEEFAFDMAVWAAGVKAAPLLANLDGLETNRNNQLVVRPTLQTTVDDRVFAIGDCCACPHKDSGRPVPPRAQAAHQMGKAVFQNLVRMMDGKAPVPFVYHDHGSLVSLSRYSTVGSLMGNLVGGRMAVEGRMARFAYMSLYRMHLLAIHGWLRGSALIAVGHVNRIVRPKLKVH